MLETVLTHLRNWFPVAGGKHAGTFEIISGVPAVDFLKPGQYYRVKGSVWSNGLHCYMEDELQEERFQGEIWALAIPPEVISLAGEIEAWREKNPETDKLSESFGGYSYTRGAAGATGAAGANGSGWQAVFAARLAPYRRAYDD